MQNIHFILGQKSTCWDVQRTEFRSVETLKRSNFLSVGTLKGSNFLSILELFAMLNHLIAQLRCEHSSVEHS